MTNMKMMSKEDFLKVLMGLLENQGIKTSVFIMKKEHGSYTGIHRVSDNDGETIAAIVNVDDLSKTAQKTPSDGVTTFLVKQSGGEECASGYTGLSQRSFTSASASYIFSSASLAFLFPAP